MKKLFRKAWVNAKNADQISVQFQTIELGTVESASLAAQGITNNDIRTAIQSFKRSVFEKTFPGYTPGATADAAIVVNQEFPKFMGVDWKIQQEYTTDSSVATSNTGWSVVKNSTTLRDMTSGGAVVYRRSTFTVDMNATDDAKLVYDKEVAVATPSTKATT